MARRKVDPQSDYDQLFDRMSETASAEYPGRYYTGDEAAQLLICLPVPSILLRYLLQQEGWPLSRFTMLVGEQASCKTAFLFEIMRWHRMAKGKGVLIDAEHKVAPDLGAAILNYDSKAVSVHKCRTLDEVCQVWNFWIQLLRTEMDGTTKKPGAGRRFPFCLGIDSLAANLDEKEHERIVKEGIPQRHFAFTAGMLTDFMKVFTKELDGYPISAVGINHLKIRTDPRGIPIRGLVGGAALKFHEATEIEMKRLSTVNPAAKTQVRRVENGTLVEGIELRISLMKNSNAPQSTIEVEMSWSTDFDNPVEVEVYDSATDTVRKQTQYRKRIWFDWHTAAIQLLSDLMTEKSPVGRRLSEILDIEVGTTRQAAWSRMLGVSEKAKVSYRELGEMLEAHLEETPSLRDELYPTLGIMRRPLFKGGRDMRDVMADVAKASSKTSVKLPAAPEEVSGAG